MNGLRILLCLVISTIVSSDNVTTSTNQKAGQAIINNVEYIKNAKQYIARYRELTSALQKEVEDKLNTDAKKTANLDTEALWQLVLKDLEFVHDKTDQYYNATDKLSREESKKIFGKYMW